MTPEILENLFDLFFTTKESGRGTGLGLATVYGIVKQNNGFINVYSEPAHGTTIKIYLPKIESEAVKTPEKVDEKNLPEGTETVLLAEDEDALLNISRDILERQEYKVNSKPRTGTPFFFESPPLRGCDILRQAQNIIHLKNLRYVTKRIFSQQFLSSNFQSPS